MTKKESIEKQEGPGLVITRIFDAPREAVWKAWTDPVHFTSWWGPKQFTVPFVKIDLRVGGKILSAMRSPDGKEFWSTGVYREIIPPERLVMTDSFADEKGNIVSASHYGMQGEWPLEMVITVTFEDVDGKTKMVLRHAGIPAGEMLDETRAGWNQSFDKLSESLAEKAETAVTAEPGKQELIITRIFDAPRSLVFKAYTDPALIPKWWGPRRFTTDIDKMEIRPGGTWRFVQHDAGGNEYAFHGVYHDIVPPVRIVQTFEFEGTPGQVSLETAIFEDLGNRTRVTSKAIYRSVNDRDEMIKAGMNEGVAESMQRLDELLVEIAGRRKAA